MHICITPFDAEYTFFGMYFFRKKLQHTLPKNVVYTPFFAWTVYTPFLHRQYKLKETVYTP